MTERSGIQRSKSLGRADKKTYAFGSSTPRELSHLNLPHKYRVVSSGPQQRSRLGEALSSSPVRRIPEFKARPVPKSKPPPRSPERKPATPKKKPETLPKADSPKRRPPSKLTPKSQPAASDDTFHIADLAPVGSEPKSQENGLSSATDLTPEPGKPPDLLAEDAKSAASNPAADSNGLLDEAKETVATMGGLIEAGVGYVADKAADLKEEIGERAESLGWASDQKEDAEDELVDLHAKLHDTWQEDQENSIEEKNGEHGEKDNADMEIVEESANHEVDVEHHIEQGEEPPFQAHEEINIPEEAEMTAAHTTEGMSATNGVTGEAVVQQKPVVEALGAMPTGGAGSDALDDGVSPREDIGLGSPGEHDDEHVPSF